MRLQCDAAKSRKVGNEQPSKQPLKIALEVVQNARVTGHSGLELRWTSLMAAWWLSRRRRTLAGTADFCPRLYVCRVAKWESTQGPCGSDLSTQSQRGTQRIVDACLPSVSTCTEGCHHIGIQPDFDGLFGDFLFASHGTASAARNNLLWRVNPRKRGRLGLCQGLTQPR